MLCPNCNQEWTSQTNSKPIRCPFCYLPFNSDKNLNLDDFEILKGNLLKYTGDDSIVVLPDSIKIIGEKNTKKIERDDPKIFIESPFRNCNSITDITIPDSVKIIGISAFANCKNLTIVRLPSSLECICHLAFANCKKLKSIIIPNETSILDGAFKDCDSLEEHARKKIESINPKAFDRKNKVVTHKKTRKELNELKRRKELASELRHSSKKYYPDDSSNPKTDDSSNPKTDHSSNPKTDHSSNPKTDDSQ